MESPSEAQSNPAVGQEQKHYYFQTETSTLKKYYLLQENHSEIINRRILFNNSVGTVRYFGELKHEGAEKTNELWIGVEWDEKNRGKHNGTVKGCQYFSCPQGQGSMVKYEKIEFGYNLQTSLFKRYFKVEEMHHAKNIYEELKAFKKNNKNNSQSNSKVKQQNLEEKPATEDSATEQESKDETSESTSENKQLVKHSIESLKKKTHKVEYDAESYFSTLKKNKKVMVEFIGFDEIWTKINSVDKIQSISLPECRICDLGPIGHLGDLLTNLKILSLEDNLLSDYTQIYQLGTELPQLTQLSLTNNLLAEPQKAFEELDSFKVIGHEEHISLNKGETIFSKLKTLILINTGLKWKIFFKIIGAFGKLNDLFLCRNDLTDYENFDSGKLKHLEFLTSLNLEDTKLADVEHLLKWKNLAYLQKLTLNKNPIEDFGKHIEGFEALKQLSVQYTGARKPVVIYQLSNFRNVENLNFRHNPVNDLMGNEYCRLRAIAEFQKLKIINGSPLSRYQRKDSEIYYMRESFREYFAMKKVPDYDYDFQDFLKWCEEFHPNIQLYIKKYGNPFEVEEKKENKELVKKEVKQTEIKKGTGMVSVQIYVADTEATIAKKLPLSWTLNNLKNFFAKTYKIPSANQKLVHKNAEEEVEEEMTEDHKPLNFYSLCSSSTIILNRVE